MTKTKNPTPEPETTRLTITWSKKADLILRSYLGAQGMKKGDISKFIEEAVRWRIFHDTVQKARTAFADVAPDEGGEVLHSGNTVSLEKEMAKAGEANRDQQDS